MVNQEQRLDQVFAALSDPTRRAIVAQLSSGPKTVSELAEPFDMSLAAVSKHLKVLDRAGLLARQRLGRSIECSLDAVTLKAAADWIGDYEKFWNERLTRLEHAIKQRKRKPQ